MSEFNSFENSDEQGSNIIIITFFIIKKRLSFKYHMGKVIHFLYAELAQCVFIAPYCLNFPYYDNTHGKVKTNYITIIHNEMY